ncbi:MAG TPA: zinc-dependent metalloprotease, partial [Gammaproteobacteria bacterium]
AQRAALDAVLETLSPDELRVPQRLVPLLSAARNGSSNRQYTIELFANSAGTPFDPLVAADAAAELTLRALLAPARLARLDVQHAADPKALGVEELLDRLQAATLPDDTDALTRRIAYRTIVTLAQVAHNPKTTPGVAALLDQRVHEMGVALAHRHGSAADQAWGASLSRQMLDPQQLDKLLAKHARAVEVPPGSPIDDEGNWLSMPGED